MRIVLQFTVEVALDSYCLISRLARMAAQSLAFPPKHLVIFSHLSPAQSSGWPVSPPRFPHSYTLSESLLAVHKRSASLLLSPLGCSFWGVECFLKPWLPFSARELLLHIGATLHSLPCQKMLRKKVLFKNRMNCLLAFPGFISSWLRAQKHKMGLFVYLAGFLCIL